MIDLPCAFIFLSRCGLTRTISIVQMVGRAKAPATTGRRTRSATAGPSDEQHPQDVVDFRAEMRAMEQRFADQVAQLIQAVAQPAVVQPPVVQAVEQPVVVPQLAAAAAPVVVPAVAGQEAWLRLIERFQKMRAPEFQGGSDPQAAVRWREDISSVLSYMGVDSIHRQRLEAYTLKGDAGMWYRARFTEAERLTTDWEYFVYCFEQQFVSSAARARKERELMSLEQGDMSVDAYETRFTTLSHFTGNMFQTEERKARMFEAGLRPGVRRLVVAQRLPTLALAADSARALEIDQVTSQKGKEAAGKATAVVQSQQQGKGKRPFAAVAPQQQQQHAVPQQPSAPFQRHAPGSCYNCGQMGHRQVACPFPKGQGPTQ